MNDLCKMIGLKLMKVLFYRERPTIFDVFFAYRLLLNRLPDESGWEHFLKHKKQHHLSLIDLLNLFWNSSEFSIKCDLLNQSDNAPNYENTPIQEEIVELSDFSIFIDRNDKMVGEAIKVNRYYEPHVTAALKKILKTGQTFVDVGANIGYFSLLASIIVRPNGKVIALEPMVQNYSLFEKSIKLNEIKNIELQRIAALNENKPINMIQVKRFNSGSFHILNDPHWNMDIYTVEGKRIDDFLYNEKIDVVKIDVEGAEGLVLKGMLETIKKSRPVIFMEFSPLSLIDISKIAGDELLGMLQNLDYSFQDVDSFKGKFFGKTNSKLNKLLKNRKSTHLDIIVFPNSLLGTFAK